MAARTRTTTPVTWSMYVSSSPAILSKKDQEINGLTFGSVGAGTTIDHIQVSYSNDDSYEWFGGTVECKHLIAYRGWDDDFDTDNGFSGSLTYGLSVRDSKIADASQSNGFESDNNAGGTTAEPYTTAKFSYITLLGPKTFDANFVNDASYITAGNLNPQNGSSLGKFQAAMHIRRNSRLNVSKTLAIGWPIGIILDNEKGDTQGAATKGLMALQNNTFVGNSIIASDFNKVYKDSLYDYKTKTVNPEKVSATHSIILNPEYNNTVVSAWTPIAFDGIASILSLSKLYSGIGAFPDGTDWTTGWTNWDPENTKY